MYSKIVQLCYLGEPRADADVANDPGVRGELTMVWWQGRPRLICQAWGIQNESGRLLPALHQVRMIGLLGTGFKYEGIQRTKLGDRTYATCYQQWQVEILGM